MPQISFMPRADRVKELRHGVILHQKRTPKRARQPRFPRALIGVCLLSLQSSALDHSANSSSPLRLWASGTVLAIKVAQSLVTSLWSFKTINLYQNHSSSALFLIWGSFTLVDFCSYNLFSLLGWPNLNV